MSSSIRRVGIYGSSSGRNAGDAALIGAIMEACDKEFGQRLVYDIPTYRPDYILYEYPNKTKPVSMLPWHGAYGMFSAQTALSFRQCDLNIIYDNMLFDRKLWDQLFNYMPAVWAYFTKCKRKNQLLGMYNVGTGPVTTARGRSMLREIADACDLITIRDQDSLTLLRDVGVTHNRVLVTADAAVGLEPSSKDVAKKMLNEVGLELGQEVLGCNVNSYLNTWSDKAGSSLTPEAFADIYAAAVTKVAKEINVPLVFIATQHSDMKITKLVTDRIPKDIKTAVISNIRYNHADMKAVLGEISFLFAMRLHANILATSMCTPAVALSFQKKVTSYYTDLGLEKCLMNFDSFSSDSLYNHAIWGWNNRAAIRAHLEHRMPFVKQKALVAALAFKVLAKTRNPDEAVKVGNEALLQIQQNLAPLPQLAVGG